MTTLRNGGDKPSRSGNGETAEGAGRKARAKASTSGRNATAQRHDAQKSPEKGGKLAAKQARVKRRHSAAIAPIEPVEVPPAREGTLLTANQMREARRIIRERAAISRKEREFGKRLVTTLTEGQNALNIAFGAILSAYIGTVLAAIDNRPFNQWTLAAFFVLIGVFIGGLCIGNLVVLRKHFGLGLGFLVTGAVAASLSLDAARSLGFELPILKVMFICWYAMLVATDGLLTAIVFFHHRQVLRREAQLNAKASA